MLWSKPRAAALCLAGPSGATLPPVAKAPVTPAALPQTRQGKRQGAPPPLQPLGFGAILGDAASRAAAGVAAASGKNAAAANRERLSEIALQDAGYIYQQLVAPAAPPREGGAGGDDGGRGALRAGRGPVHLHARRCVCMVLRAAVAKKLI